ncbi:MAG: fibrobacter succinogenes major paralogous domain-containing protein [Bacteroidales bacterium]|nr:fibrobacter succinogenes major paralogous domain-containing protein [Bacteroidales bacterium]
MVATEGTVALDIADINGRIVVANDYTLQPGSHQFRITLATAGTYVMTARQNGQTTSIKMVCNGGTDANKMEYIGTVETHGRASLQSPKSQNAPKYTTNNPFTFGDQMEYVGYATINGSEAESQRIMQAQGASQTFTLQFTETQTQVQLPTVTTNAVSNITQSSATVGGVVTSDGGETVFDRGICYSTTTMPTVSNNCLHIGQGTGSFSDNLTGLTANTTYYVRAYAMSSAGTAYGNEVSFTTNSGGPAITVTTNPVTDISYNSATCGGNVIYNGEENIIERGVCWNTTPNPNINHNHIACGNGVGNFTRQLTGLTPNTIYYVRAYATSVFGTVYGNEVNFTTLPEVMTSAISNVTSNSAICGGNVTAAGSVTVTSRGVCWSTLQNPTVSDSHTTDGSGMGSFTSNITGLTPATTYYVRAYATNSAGTAYGNKLYFTTPGAYDGQPCPGASTVTDIDNNTYNTVQIGNQCWMKENLRTTRYSNGTSIGSLYYPNNDQYNVSNCGYLYTWFQVMGNSSSSSANSSGVQGICPIGWHVPSDAEWTQLTNYVESQSQYQCGIYSSSIAKALASTTGWNSSTNNCAVGNNSSTNNATGFSALPAGYYSGVYYYHLGNNAYFWSATENLDGLAYYRYLGYNSDNVYSSNYVKYYGYSVRCVRD